MQVPGFHSDLQRKKWSTERGDKVLNYLPVVEMGMMSVWWGSVWKEFYMPLLEGMDSMLFGDSFWWILWARIMFSLNSL